jgi:hypothetical protein
MALVALAFPLAAAIVALIVLHASAPFYLLHRGFPLDDAWIHAVYAREIARSATMAYNPGVAATGETAPLWAIVLAPLHGLTPNSAAAVIATKVFGFLLHVASGSLLAFAIAKKSDVSALPAYAGAALVMLHPDLVSASVSGMEVPLATLAIAASILSAVRSSALLVAIAAALATTSRPETAVVAACFPVLFWGRERPLLALRLSLSAVAGGAVSLVAVGVRNYFVSGMFLPATFHAKVGGTSPFDLAPQELGFTWMLGQFPLLNSVTIIMLAAVVSVILLCRRSTKPEGRAAGAMFLSGTAFCVVSFMLVAPVDPPAFYHQRYVLPGVFLMVAALPMLVAEMLAWLPHPAYRPVWLLIVFALAAIAMQSAPQRYRRLSNDALNIDDVQVAFGKALATAAPTDNAWVVDAGGPRFFGNAFVVDLMGLNTPQILQPDAQAYLDERPPKYLDLFPRWSAIQSQMQLPQRSFETSTPYTVTSVAAMRRHVLVSCEPAGTSGRVTIRRNVFTFRCAP